MAKHSASTSSTSVWRTIVGVIGELLITAGVLILLFIVWQIWWTDIGARREQTQLISSFQEQAPPRVESDEYEEFYDNPPLVDKDMLAATLDTNEVWGVIHIPRFGDDFQVSVAEGVDLAKVLDKGSLGHYPDTQVPGEFGNFALAGHRQTYGAPLKDQPNLVDGDAIILETEEAWYVYKVTGHEVVMPSQTDVIAPVPKQPDAEPDRYYLTLTTCHPPFVSNERWITWAEMEYWIPRDAGTPKEL